MAPSNTSEDEDYLPVGISMLNIHSKKPSVPVMGKKISKDTSDLPEELRYCKLLARGMNIMNKNKEEEKERLKLGISVIRKNKKTFINIVFLAHQLNRQPEHLSYFVSKILMSEGSINKEGNLVMSGTFLQSAVEKALRQFIEQYVICKSCDSVVDTYITRENKLYFIKCDNCKGSRCVGNSIEGFSLNKEKSPKIKSSD